MIKISQLLAVTTIQEIHECMLLLSYFSHASPLRIALMIQTEISQQLSLACFRVNLPEVRLPWSPAVRQTGRAVQRQSSLHLDEKEVAWFMFSMCMYCMYSRSVFVKRTAPPALSRNAHRISCLQAAGWNTGWVSKTPCRYKLYIRPSVCVSMVAAGGNLLLCLLIIGLCLRNYSRLFIHYIGEKIRYPLSPWRRKQTSKYVPPQNIFVFLPEVSIHPSCSGSPQIGLSVAFVPMDPINGSVAAIISR